MEGVSSVSSHQEATKFLDNERAPIPMGNEIYEPFSMPYDALKQRTLRLEPLGVVKMHGLQVLALIEQRLLPQEMLERDRRGSDDKELPRYISGLLFDIRQMGAIAAKYNHPSQIGNAAQPAGDFFQDLARQGVDITRQNSRSRRWFGGRDDSAKDRQNYDDYLKDLQRRLNDIKAKAGLLPESSIEDVTRLTEAIYFTNTGRLENNPEIAHEAFKKATRSGTGIPEAWYGLVRTAGSIGEIIYSLNKLKVILGSSLSSDAAEGLGSAIEHARQLTTRGLSKEEAASKWQGEYSNWRDIVLAKPAAVPDAPLVSKEPSVPMSDSLFGQNSPFIPDDLEEEIRLRWEGVGGDAFEPWKSFYDKRLQEIRQARSGKTADEVVFAMYLPNGRLPKGLKAWAGDTEPAPGARVAVKIARHGDGRAVDSLNRERQALLQANAMFQDDQSARPVRILGYGENERGDPYLVLEYIGKEYQPLTHITGQTSSMSEEQIVRLGLRLAMILSTLHRAGIGYGDLGQMSNIYYDPSTENVRLIDFGNAFDVLNPGGKTMFDDRLELAYVLSSLLKASNLPGSLATQAFIKRMNHLQGSQPRVEGGKNYDPNNPEHTREIAGELAKILRGVLARSP